MIETIVEDIENIAHLNRLKVQLLRPENLADQQN